MFPYTSHLYFPFSCPLGYVVRLTHVSALLVFQRCLTQSQSGNPWWCSQPSSDEQQYTGNYSRSVELFPLLELSLSFLRWRKSALLEMKVT